MATPSPLAFALLLVLLVAGAGGGLRRAAAAVLGGRGPLLGGYQPIKDVRDPQITEIAVYAVAEHNRQSGQHLALVRVVSGQQQVVAGMNYRLILEARFSGKAPRLYEAVVYERAWEKYRSLTSFNPKA